MIALIILAAFGVVTPIFFRRTPLHPCFWMPPFITIYGGWFAVARLVSHGALLDSEIKALWLALTAGVTFVLGGALATWRYRAPDTYFIAPQAFERGIFYFVSALFFAFMVYALGAGFSSKRQLVDVLYSSGPLISILVVFFSILSARRVLLYFSGKASIKDIYFLFLFTFLILLVMGERNFIFSIIFFTFFVFAYKKKSTPAYALYMMAVITLLLALPVTQAFKSILLSGSGIDVSFERIFVGEFTSQGRNLVWIIETDPQFSGLQVLKAELVRAFSFSIFGTESQSMARWFNQEYRHDIGVAGSSGWGFSIIASGYMWAGALGVAAYFATLGLLAAVLYRLFFRSGVTATIYLSSMPIFIYVMRQDMSFLIGDLLKTSLVMVAFMIFTTILRRASRHGNEIAFEK